ncbi:MAG: hypothetical protein GY839_07370 [candidate division Zixibacteria bacterium]|nr:hypothetical protein [candidate division Zixibacteria bacterium]
MAKGLRQQVLAILIFTLICGEMASPDSPGPEPVNLSPRIGQEIDSGERDFYHLFPDIKGFIKAEFFRISPSEYKLSYVYNDNGIAVNKERKITSEAFELTRVHTELTDKYYALDRQKSDSLITESGLMYKLSLKYASRANYELSRQLLADIIKEYPDSPIALKADSTNNSINQIWNSKKVLFVKGSLIDHSGRTNLLIFSGYYGLWLGIATPIALKADSPQLFALGLLLGAPLSIYTAGSLTRDGSISRGKATMISLGGHLGTWQGLGWASKGNNEGSAVVGIGEISGLVGILSANYLSNKIDFTEGHAAIMNSGVNWGGWFGVVFSSIVKDDEILRDMLIGSDVAVIGSGILAKDSRASNGRIRLINLAGIVGMVAGFGLDLMFQVDDSGGVMAIAGAGSVAGLLAGVNLTKNYDKGSNLTLLKDKSSIKLSFFQNDQLTISPIFTFKNDQKYPKSYMPYFGLNCNF